MFLFCESAMIALWHGKQVETAFFLADQFNYVQKAYEGGFSAQILLSHHCSGWDQVVEKGRKSKSGVVPAMA